MLSICFELLKSYVDPVATTDKNNEKMRERPVKEGKRRDVTWDIEERDTHRQIQSIWHRYRPHICRPSSAPFGSFIR